MERRNTKRPTTRFQPGRWSRWLVPLVLALLTLALLGTLVLVGLAVLRGQ